MTVFANISPSRQMNVFALFAAGLDGLSVLAVRPMQRSSL